MIFCLIHTLSSEVQGGLLMVSERAWTSREEAVHTGASTPGHRAAAELVIPKVM